MSITHSIAIYLKHTKCKHHIINDLFVYFQYIMSVDRRHLNEVLLTGELSLGSLVLVC